MATNVSFKPARTGFSRVFLIEGRARPDHAPSYQSNMKAGAPSYSAGDIEKIEVPDPNTFDGFIEVGVIRGDSDRPSITVTGRYAADIKSTLLRLARQGCAVDVQINFGQCTNPSNNNTFTKKVIIEAAYLTDWEAEDLGALGTDERAMVNEEATISGRDIYEIVPVNWAEKGGDVITNELLDVTLCDTPSCGDCETESNGCKRIFAISSAAGGSPTTPADVVFSLDGGTTIYAHDIDTLGTSDNPSGIICLGDNLVVVSEASESLHYAPIADFNAYTDPAFTEVSTGFVVGAGGRKMSATPNRIYIAAADGYIYMTENPASGVTALESGSLTTSDFNDIVAYTDDFVVAVGNAGQIVKTENGATFASVPSPVGVGVNINTVKVYNKTTYLIGTSNGRLYYTLNSGESWTEKTFTASGTGAINHIVSAGETVLYMSHTVSSRAKILVSVDGGNSWVVAPQSSGSLPLADRINRLAACEELPEYVFGVGLADNATDGFMLIGTE